MARKSYPRPSYAWTSRCGANSPSENVVWAWRLPLRSAIGPPQDTGERVIRSGDRWLLDWRRGPAPLDREPEREVSGDLPVVLGGADGGVRGSPAGEPDAPSAARALGLAGQRTDECRVVANHRGLPVVVGVARPRRLPVIAGRNNDRLGGPGSRGWCSNLNRLRDGRPCPGHDGNDKKREDRTCHGNHVTTGGQGRKSALSATR